MCTDHLCDLNPCMQVTINSAPHEAAVPHSCTFKKTTNMPATQLSTAMCNQ